MFDEAPCLPIKNNTLDWEVIETLFKNVKKEITPQRTIDLQLLVSYAGKETPSNGGVILFGTNRLQLFPDAIIKCVRFYGLDKSDVIDQLEITDYPILALEEVLKFVRRNTKMAAQFGELQRVDIPEYPPIAVREAITNAILHADYASKGASIMIAIFNDRMEISNPGGLPFGMTMERALGGSSRVRNRVIARVFKELKLIEQWGSGLRRIITSCAQHGLIAPKFEDGFIDFQVTLYNNKPATEPELNIADEKLVLFLKDNKRISTKDAALLWGITPRSSRDRLKRMVNEGLIERIGNAKNDPNNYYVLCLR